MVVLSKVVNGLRKFVDLEFLPKISGLNKWIIGAGVSMLLDDSVNIMNTLKQNDFIKIMKIINDENEIDVDRLYESLLTQARKTPVTFNIPMLGNITLKDSDIVKIYEYIKE